MNSSQELLERITRPSPRLIDDIAKISGDIMIVGAGGKVGPSLAVTARRACEAAGLTKRILAVSKLDDPAAAETMRHWGVQVVEADLLDSQQLDALPEMDNILFLAGRKFGTYKNQTDTWAANVLLPAKICERFPKAGSSPSPPETSTATVLPAAADPWKPTRPIRMANMVRPVSAGNGCFPITPGAIKPAA